jgi:predicted nucleotidyltransferase
VSLVTEDALQEMTAVVVEAVDPEVVILFGSRARGPGEDVSDVDLLIVEKRPFGPSDSRREEMAKIWRLLARFPVAQDILIYSPEEVERWRSSKNHVIARALRQGKVLYERP